MSSCETELMTINNGIAARCGACGSAAGPSAVMQWKEQVQRVQTLEALAVLAGGIAHDFNNLLSGIVGYTQLGMHQLPPHTDTASHLEQVLLAAARAEALVKQLLSLCKKTDGERKTFQAAGIASDVATLLKDCMPENIEVRLSIDEKAPLINADPVQIHQLLVSLCMHAAQVMEARGGLISIELASRFADELPRDILPPLQGGCYLRLAVRYSGQGMAAECIPGIFDDVANIKGTGAEAGMELAVAGAVVKKHGGSIYAEHVPDGGFVIAVVLPAAEVQTGQSSHAMPSALSGAAARVLFIDNEPYLVDVGSEMLRSLGCTVRATTNPLDALAEFAADPDAFDIIITDQVMPGITGLELARKAGSIRSGVPVVLCTGYDEMHSKQACEQAGVEAVLQKPVRMHQLAHTLRSIIGRK